MNLDIINGTVADPTTGPAGIRPLYIRDGKITLATDKPADRVIDAAGLYVLPGMIDAHCHLRDPGLVYKEDIATGTASAAKGGFTAVACMANTQPVCDNAAVVGYIRNKAERVGKTRVHPIGAVSKNLEGRELAEIGLMAQEGIVALSDDGKPVVSADFMRKAMQYASDFGLVIISHCEDPSLVDGAMNEGEWSTLMGLRGIPAAAEEIQVAREAILAESLGLRIHIAHVSTRGSVRIVREAKARGVKITCETCPHYFTLTEEACKGYNTLAKVNPPLRTEDDRQAILEGIRDGTIDMIVTDHAPHHEDEKQVEFALAANGFIGFESAFPLMNQHLLQAGVVTLDQLVELTSVNPAKLFGLESGTLQEGAVADVLIADLDDEWVFDRFATASKAKNAPYHGMTMRGRARWTIVGGDIVHEFIR